jgi:hypothetical protein
VPESSAVQSTGSDLAAADMVEVDRVIRQRLSSDVTLIDQISSYIIGAGGMPPACWWATFCIRVPSK